MDTSRKLWLVPTGACLLLTACNGSPSVDVIGSFFPVWMLCLTIGIVLTFIARSLLVRVRLDPEVGPVAIFYPALVVLFTGVIWLVFFR